MIDILARQDGLQSGGRRLEQFQRFCKCAFTFGSHVGANSAPGTEVVQVRDGATKEGLVAHTDLCDRMLENPSDESVVRWGNDGDSFVVLEVCRERCRAGYNKPNR